MLRSRIAITIAIDVGVDVGAELWRTETCAEPAVSAPHRRCNRRPHHIDTDNKTRYRPVRRGFRISRHREPTRRSERIMHPAREAVGRIRRARRKHDRRYSSSMNAITNLRCKRQPTSS
ncbi:hypothetical protein LA76x_0610 [Lysobacter antibioticus]|uniref:Uncharacterized protein n=1 Tax=Lysobacter antibioticus TaxID=84531 RepID=A0A0S2F5J0_LYSAN|nr:hypothetical protein LA76x_0610 [Lysobacter antibioticus]